jgi:hypothetical protein
MPLNMTEDEKLEKLINALRDFIKCLDNLQDLRVHRNISQSYYMQKAAELELLHQQMKDLFDRQEANKKMINWLGPEVYYRWKQDAQWLQHYFTSQSVECPFHHDLSM